MIRKANNDDLDKLTAIARIVALDMHASGIDQWSETYPDYEHFKKDLDREALDVFVFDGQVIGSISTLPENDPFYLQLVWIVKKALVVHRLMVLPEYRRQKIGSQLLNYAIEKARIEGYDGVKIDTHPDNLRMQGLILSCGFHEVGYMTVFNRIGYELKF
jgi:GNAT superfamily N-acetyltransferase